MIFKKIGDKIAELKKNKKNTPSPATEEGKKISLLLDDLISLEGYVHDLFSFSPLPICFVSPANVILEVNPAFEKIANFRFEEIVGESITKIFEEGKITRLSEDILKEDAISGREMRIFPKEGKPLSVQAFAKARKNEKGMIIGFFLGVFDLTEINKTQDELKRSQVALLNILEDTDEARQRAEGEREKTEAIINSFSDGLLVFDQEDNLILVNPMAENYFGVKKEEIINQAATSLADYPQFKPLNLLLKAKVKNDSRQDLELNPSLIADVSIVKMKKGTSGVGYFIVLHDITREKIVEKLKTEFVSISAHQLRTPLSAIKWTLRMLLDGDMGKISKEQEEFLNRTYRSNERMIDLVNSLLNVTRIEEGRFLYKPTLIDVGEMVRALIESYRIEIEKKKIKFQFKKPAKFLPQIWGDAEKIQLAFQNLIDNAIRYTLSGGKVEISLRQIKGMIEFKVEDEGVGIPENQQERLFTKFFRGSNVMRLDTEGTGLGLFITKNVVEAHGGKIEFKSKENKGSTFWIFLPIKKESGKETNGA